MGRRRGTQEEGARAVSELWTGFSLGTDALTRRAGWMLVRRTWGGEALTLTPGCDPDARVLSMIIMRHAEGVLKRDGRQ